jgi:hypothetical protein
MAVPTDKADGQTITSSHINAIASLANTNETDVAVIKEAPKNLAHPEYGLVNGGSIVTPLTDALSDLGSAGGDILIPAGAFTASSWPSFHDKGGIRLRGLGGTRDGAGDPATKITYSGTSSLLFTSTAGVALEDLALWYSNASLTGTFLDFSKAGGADDTLAPAIRRCWIGGDGVRGAARLVDLDGAIVGSFEDNYFDGAVRAVRGRNAGATNYSNGHNFRGNYFLNCVSPPILDSGEAWTFTGDVFQQLVTGGGSSAGAGAFSYDGSQIGLGLTLNGIWCGDADTTGTWVDYVGVGLSVNGGFFQNGQYAFRLSGTNTDAVSILNPTCWAQNTAAIRIESATMKDHVLVPRIASTTPAKFSIAGFPSASILHGGSGGDFLDLLGVRIFTSTVSDAVYPAVPPDGTIALENVGGVRKVCARIGSVWYKATLT